MADLPRAPSETKVVFIGLDGASWNIIDPMIESGELPFFAKLKAEGAWCNLRSTRCLLSASAWTSMMTGCIPEKTGIYSFVRVDSFTAEMVPTDARDLVLPRVWDITSVAGLRTAVVNIPITYPPRPVNGIMLSGFLTPGVVPLKIGTPVRVTARRANIKETSRVTGKNSYSPPCKAVRNIFRNRFTIYLLDTIDDRKYAYDEACVVIDPIVEKKMRSNLQSKAFVKLDSISTWVRINYLGDKDPSWGWAKVKLSYEKKSNQVEIESYPIYFDLADTSVHLCYPKELRQKLLRDLGRYLPYAGYNRKDIVDFVFEKEKYLNYLYNLDAWDLFMFEFQETDKLQHEDGFGAYTRELYRRLDSMLDSFVSNLPENTTVFLASDHGFKPYLYEIGLNAWFDKLGLLVRNRDLAVDKVRSFVFHYDMNIYVNRRLLEKEYRKIKSFHVPPGGGVYQSFLDYLIRLGASFEHPVTGEPMPLRFSRYGSPRVEPSPDLLVEVGSNHYRVIQIDRTDKRTELFYDLKKRGDSWYHAPAGIFVAYGKNISKGSRLGERSIVDVAPTMLYALGIPCSDYFDGEVMLEVFSKAHRKEHPVEVYAGYSDLAAPEPKKVAGERETLEEKMRALGYIE